MLVRTLVAILILTVVIDQVGATPPRHSKIHRLGLIAGGATMLSLGGCGRILNAIAMRNSDPVTDSDRAMLSAKLSEAGLQEHAPVKIYFIPQTHSDPATAVKISRLSMEELTWEKILSLDSSAEHAAEFQFEILKILRDNRPGTLYIEGVTGSFDEVEVTVERDPLYKERPVIGTKSEQLKKFTADVTVLEVPVQYHDLKDNQKIILYLSGAEAFALAKGYVSKISAGEPPVDRTKTMKAITEGWYYDGIGRDISEDRETNTICLLVGEAPTQNGTCWLVFGAAHLFEDYSRPGLDIQRVHINGPDYLFPSFIRR